MDLLDWARGPLFYASLAIFALGIAWRLTAYLRLPATPGAVAPQREPFGRLQVMSAALRRTWPRRSLPQSATLVTFNPYVFHIGLALVFLGYAPHIAFIRLWTGVGWPALPDMVIYLAAVATIISLLLALMFRLTDPVLKKISRADDMLTWAITMLPLMTGMAVVGASPSDFPLYKPALAYRDPIALHLLSLQLLLVWFPFGKLMHAFLVFPSRMQLATFLGRRGVPP